VTAAEEHVELLRRWNDTYESDGFEGAEKIIEEIFDPEVEFSPLLARELEGRTFNGHEGLRTFFGELNDTLGEVRYEQAEFQDDLVRRLTAYGSRDQAMRAAREAQNA